jgi:hypothetical protein
MGTLSASPKQYQRALTIGFYTVLGGLIVGILLDQLRLLTSDDLIAGRIARNSEGIVLLLILALWIQFIRPRLADSPREWAVTLTAALMSLGLGLLLFLTDPINRVKTLNETFLAAGILIPYIQLRRPIPVALPLALSGGVLVLVLFGSSDSTITLLAEAEGALILTPIALDLVDRGILDPEARTIPALRYGWYAFLIAAPVVFWRTDNGQIVSGWLGDALTYAGRTTEIFICLLIFELYFAVGHRRTGVNSTVESIKIASRSLTPTGARR